MVTAHSLVGQRSETVRRANLSAIVRGLHVRGPLSRSELGVLTGLTRSAIRGLIRELAEGGLVTEERSAPAGIPGRPSPIVTPDPRSAVVLALEVNVDSLAAAVVGLGGTVHDLVRVERPRTHLSLDEIAADLATLADPLLAPWRADPALLGVGVAVAGVVRRSDGVVRHAPNLGWRDAPLAARLGQVLGLDLPVAVANEADLGGLAEHRRGAATGVGSVVFVTGEVGVGGNLIVDGRPLVGAAGYAGEIGHLPVNPGGARCGCGAVGCWETEIGERALLLRAGRPVDGGRAAVEDVIAAAARGDAEALAAMEQLGDWLGLGVAALVNIFNPTLVVLGGLFERIHRFMAPSIERALEEHALAASHELVSVVPGQLGSDAPVLGAAELALEPLLADPASRLGPTRRAVAMGA